MNQLKRLKDFTGVAGPDGAISFTLKDTLDLLQEIEDLAFENYRDGVDSGYILAQDDQGDNYVATQGTI